MAKKQSTPKVSSIAGKVLARGKATLDETKRLAASVLGQDEKKGQTAKPAPKPRSKKKK